VVLNIGSRLLVLIKVLWLVNVGRGEEPTGLDRRAGKVLFCRRFNGTLQTTLALVQALAAARLIHLGKLAELLLASAVKVMLAKAMNREFD
jgi:hypothetical protein